MNMIRNLAGLLIILFLLPIAMCAFSFTASLPFTYTEVFDELSLHQLRETLLISYDMEAGYDALTFSLRNRDFILSKVNDKLILHPGTQIFLAGVDELHFEERGTVIYVCYRKGAKEYERAIASARGFYLDSFSDCDVRDDVADRDEGGLYHQSRSGLQEPDGG